MLFSQYVGKTDTVEPSPDPGVRLQLQHRRGLLQAHDGPPGPQVLRRYGHAGRGQARVREQPQKLLRHVRVPVGFRRVQIIPVADTVTAQRI